MELYEKKKRKIRLPNRILPLPNPDKQFHEKWYKGRNMLNIPHPFRCVCLGPPNVGKTTIVKNLLLRANPQFEEVIVIHCDSGYTKEYDDIGDNFELLDEIPAPEDWEGLIKTLVVLDDLEFKGMSKIQRRNLNRLFGYVSTHKNVSCILCSQDPFNVPPIVRRCSNLWILWKNQDMDAMATCARKTGLKSNNFNNIFKQLMPESKDSLWIDTTDHTPYKLRKNGYTIIKKKDNEYTKQETSKDDHFSI
jgi:ABC-type cobalamin/Fe3+-siderophores transport system ATPase subunit